MIGSGILNIRFVLYSVAMYPKIEGAIRNKY